MNCWELKKRGGPPGGEKAKALGICPVYPTHGTHYAKISGTLCGGEVQGPFASKLANCMQCDFYNSSEYDRKYKG